MILEDKFKCLVAGYYGVQEMDEYPLKEFVLYDIEKYIRNFVETEPIQNYDYKKYVEKYQDELSLKTKLQDSLIVLNEINGNLELIHMINKKIKKIN